jgi:hypothetical protein
MTRPQKLQAVLDAFRRLDVDVIPFQSLLTHVSGSWADLTEGIEQGKARGLFIDGSGPTRRICLTQAGRKMIGR